MEMCLFVHKSCEPSSSRVFNAPKCHILILMACQQWVSLCVYAQSSVDCRDHFVVADFRWVTSCQVDFFCSPRFWFRFVCSLFLFPHRNSVFHYYLLLCFILTIDACVTWESITYLLGISCVCCWFLSFCLSLSLCVCINPALSHNCHRWLNLFLRCYFTIRLYCCAIFFLFWTAFLKITANYLFKKKLKFMLTLKKWGWEREGVREWDQVPFFTAIRLVTGFPSWMLGMCVSLNTVSIVDHWIEQSIRGNSNVREKKSSTATATV